MSQTTLLAVRLCTPDLKQLFKRWFLNLHPILIPVCVPVDLFAQRKPPILPTGSGVGVQRGLWRSPTLFQVKSLGKEASISTFPLTLGWGLGFPHWRRVFYSHCVSLEGHSSSEATSLQRPSGFNHRHLRQSLKGIHSVASLNLLCPQEVILNPTAFSTY